MKLEKHGLSKTKLYRVYVLMCQRCHATYNKQYHLYGGRGIKVCEEWRNSVKAFADWAYSHGYKEGLTIDRIDGDGDYCPDNCRWVDWKTQQNNRRNNRRIIHNGENHTLSEWAGILNVNAGTLSSRTQRHPELGSTELLRKPSKPQLLTINGITKPLYVWAHENNLHVQTLISRVQSGWTGNDLIKPIKQSCSRTNRRMSPKKKDPTDWR